MGLVHRAWQKWKNFIHPRAANGDHKTWPRVKLTKNKVILGIGLAFVLAGWTSGYAYYQNNLETVYHVFIDGEKVGTVKHPEEVHEWLDHELEAASHNYAALKIQVGERIDFVVEERLNSSTNLRTTINRLEERIHIQADAVKVMVGGRLIGYAPDEETVQEALDQIKLKYVDQEVLLALDERNRSKGKVSVASATGTKPGDHQTLDVRLKEPVLLEETLVNPSQVLNKEELLKRLSKPKIAKQTYTVKEGDVLGKIASQFDLTLEELLALNPGLEADSVIHAGDELTVEKEQPQLTVVHVERIIEEERIPFPTKIIKDNQMYKGKTRVEQQGKEGKKRVKYLVTKENGKEVYREAVDEQVLSAPVEEIVRSGTKVIPSRGTGQFAWPARGGYVTSGYGSRWGRLHAGIDIAGVSDRTVVAADHGKVVRAGWHSGGYGNYVVIDHQNGYRTLYAHLSSISVRAGETVERGEAIGVMGSTGHSTGVHLHFEVHRHGRTVNPLPFVR